MPAKGWTYPIDIVFRDASGHRYSVRLYTFWPRMFIMSAS
jgi:hypothetical protein